MDELDEVVGRFVMIKQFQYKNKRLQECGETMIRGVLGRGRIEPSVVEMRMTK